MRHIVRVSRRCTRRYEHHRCLTTDGLGRKQHIRTAGQQDSRTAGQQDSGSPSAGVAWCPSTGTRLPLLGASSASSRRRRTTRGYSSIGRASGCRPDGCGFETRWPRHVIRSSRRPPARARCSTHLASEVRQRSSAGIHRDSHALVKRDGPLALSRNPGLGLYGFGLVVLGSTAFAVRPETTNREPDDPKPGSRLDDRGKGHTHKGHTHMERAVAQRVERETSSPFTCPFTGPRA
jgi:hypothetical protein